MERWKILNQATGEIYKSNIKNFNADNSLGDFEKK